MSDFPTNEELRAAGAVLSRMLKAYGGNGNLHDAINTLHRLADLAAPKVADQAMDACCTDLRPTSGPRKQAAWDAIALCYALNSVAP